MNIFRKTQDEYNIILNQLLVVYAFTFPIKHYANSSAFFLILIVFLLRRNFIENFKKVFENKIVILFLIYILMHYLWFIGSENSKIIHEISKDLRYSLHLIIFMTFIRKDYLIKVLYGLLFGIFVSEIVAYLIYFDLIPHSLYFYTERVYSGFPHDPSPFVNHISYSMFLAFSIAITFYNIIKIKQLNIEKIISIIFFITMSINIFLQESRTGYILYFIIILFTLVYVNRENIQKKIFPIIFIFIITIAFLYFNFNTFNKRVQQTIHSTEKIIENSDYRTSLGARIGFLVYGSEVIQENFFFGVGTADAMDELKKRYHQKDSKLLKYNHPHNEFLFSFMKFGLFGFLLLIYIFYSIFTYQQENKFLRFILQAGTLIIFIAMMQGSFFKGWMILFWVLILTVSITKTKDNNEIKEISFNKYEFLFYTTTFLFCYITAFAKTFKYLF